MDGCESMDLGIQGISDAQLIGHGAFGSVYRARQAQLNRMVAVKLFQPDGSSEFDSLSFERECAAIGQFNWCPNIVTVFEAGMSDFGRAYIVMEYAAGGSLAERIRESGPLQEDEVTRIASELAAGLAEAHEAGLLHLVISNRPMSWLPRAARRFWLISGLRAGLDSLSPRTHLGLPARLPIRPLRFSRVEASQCSNT